MKHGTCLSAGVVLCCALGVMGSPLSQGDTKSVASSIQGSAGQTITCYKGDGKGRVALGLEITTGSGVLRVSRRGPDGRTSTDEESYDAAGPDKPHGVILAGTIVRVVLDVHTVTVGTIELD